MLASLVAVAFTVASFGSFVAGRTTAPQTDAATVVTGAFRADASTCSPFTSTNEVYNVRWIVAGIEGGICVEPDSDCARTAYVGGAVPRTCRDQNE